MPRLLLVDDNQRIHQIVETLLTATDIELTCASSGAEALEKVADGGPFDVALLDTTMQGMDGWELLAALRRDPSTARMPIAMMAGVLDAVDPETVEKAPIQGFLKKPVELRDLADRIRTLLATPVELPEPEPEPEAAAPAEAAPSFETLPYLKLSDHPIPEAAGHPIPEVSDLLILEPGDLLLEDEPAPEPASEPASEPVSELAPPEGSPMDSLELEELDLESLKGLNLEPQDETLSAAEFITEEPKAEEAAAAPDFGPEDDFGGNTLDLGVVTDELPDLGSSLEFTGEFGEESPAPAPAPAPAPEAEAAFRFEPATSLPDDWSDESESLLGMTEEPAWMERTTPTPAPPAEPEPAAASAMESHSDFDSDLFKEPETRPAFSASFPPEPPQAPEAPLEPIHSELLAEASTFREIDALPEPAAELTPEHAAEATPEHAAEATPEHAAEATPEHAPGAPLIPAAEAIPASPLPLPVDTPVADPLAVLLSDPVLMDRLAKAVASRLGDQVLREVAWEIMPEMAGRHNRN